MFLTSDTVVMLADNKVRAFVDHSPEDLLQARRRGKTVILLHPMIEYNHIIILRLQFRNMIQRIQRIKRIRSRRILRGNGKLMFRTGVHTDFPFSLLDYKSLLRFPQILTAAHIRNSLPFQFGNRGLKSYHTLIHDVVVGQRKQINSQRFESRTGRNRCNQIRSRLVNGRGIICQRDFQIKNTVRGVFQFRQKSFPNQCFYITRREQFLIAFCRHDIRTNEYIFRWHILPSHWKFYPIS